MNSLAIVLKRLLIMVWRKLGMAAPNKMDATVNATINSIKVTPF
jgi:hypothetical protein